MARGLGGSCLAALLLLGGCHSSSSPAPTPAPAPVATVAAVTLTPNRWDLPAGGGSLELTIATSANASGSMAAPNVAVTLQASSGTLSDLGPRTDATGHARVTWTGTRSAIITASAGDVLATSDIRVAGVAPPIPTPGPTPNPNPSPSPGPSPPESAGPLFVEVTASPQRTDAITPVTFSAAVRGALNTPAPVGLTYAWDFTEDGAVDSTNPTPTFLFSPRDHWTVTVFVRSNDGREGLGSVQVVVGATPAPAVSVTLGSSQSTIEVGQTITFTANASSNATAGAVVGYTWTFGDGVTATTASPTTSHSYATIGTFTARVTAITGNGTSGTATRAVRVIDLPLQVVLTASTPQTVGGVVTFTATVTSAGSVPSNLTYIWDFGDGAGTTSINTAGFTYTSKGTRTVRVTVMPPSSDGRAAVSASVVVNIS